MEKSKLKICSFYVSDWHLTAMLLPFIEERVKHSDNINTIFEKDIASNMKKLLNKLQIDNKVKESILNIGWDKIIKNKGDIILLIEGNKERIEYINKNIEKWMEKQKEKLKKRDIKIINCYEVSEFNENLMDILNVHDKILNTSGIHEIEELYSGYIKEKA